ncbi:MAG: hypothetical protein HQ517_02485 [SAR324 cluster bacterium]|nr:hypothetical protein [SAR324 cluster bacterium]
MAYFFKYRKINQSIDLCKRITEFGQFCVFIVDIEKSELHERLFTVLF